MIFNNDLLGVSTVLLVTVVLAIIYFRIIEAFPREKFKDCDNQTFYSFMLNAAVALAIIFSLILAWLMFIYFSVDKIEKSFEFIIELRNVVGLLLSISFAVIIYAHGKVRPK